MSSKSAKNWSGKKDLKLIKDRLKQQKVGFIQGSQHKQIMLDLIFEFNVNAIINCKLCK